MNPPDSPATDSPSAPQPRAFQISLSTMLLVTIVFAVMSAALLHASRIPAINEEVAAAMGKSGSGASSNRFLQIVFIMFTYSMPLMVAGVLATLTTVWKWMNRRR